MKIVDINNLINGGKDIYDEMTAKPYSVDRSWEHCHVAFLNIKNKYCFWQTVEMYVILSKMYRL